MSLIIKDRVKERISPSAGTGPITLVGAPTGSRTFATAGVVSSDTLYYCIEGPSGTWEVGVATATSSTVLARTTVLASSNANSLIDIGAAGFYYVFISDIADKLVSKDVSNRVIVGASGLIFSDATVQTTAATTPDLSGYATIAAVASGYQPLASVLTNTTASFTIAQETKLSGISSGATVNLSDAVLLDRTNHTGTQSYTTIVGLGTLAIQNGTFSGTSSGTNTGDQDLSSYATIAGVMASFQPLDADLTTIAGLTATTDSFIQAKGSAWASRTVAQVKTDLGITGSGDFSLKADITGATGSLVLPSGTTAQRDGSPSAGYSRWNTTTSRFERWTGSVWENYVRLSGDTMTGPLVLPPGSKSVASIQFGHGADTGIFSSVTAGYGFSIAGVSFVRTGDSSSGFSLHPSWGFCWGASEADGTPDAKLNRKSAGLIAARSNSGLAIRNYADSADADLTCAAITASSTLTLQNGVTAVLAEISKTYTSSTSREYLGLGYDSGLASYFLGSRVGSAGGSAQALKIGHLAANGTTFVGVTVATSGNVGIGTTPLNPLHVYNANTTDVARFENTNNETLFTNVYNSVMMSNFNSTVNNWAKFSFGGNISSPTVGAASIAAQFLDHTNNYADLAFFTRSASGYTEKIRVSSVGNITFAQSVSTTGSPNALVVTGAAHTTLTASTEAVDINFNLARTVQFSTGAITTQRAMRVQAPTYAFVGASTITTASTFSISGAPVAGTNATITNAYALNVESGASNFGGAVAIDAAGSSGVGLTLWQTADHTTNYGKGTINFSAGTSPPIIVYNVSNAGTFTAGYHSFRVNGTTVLDIDSLQATLAGNLFFSGDNVKDIGRLSATPFRPRTVYVGTSMQVGLPANTAISGVLHVGGTLTLQNSTTAVLAEIYKTYTSASSNEFLGLGYVSGISGYFVGSRVDSSAGGTNRTLYLGHLASNGTTFVGMTVATNGTVTASTDVNSSGSLSCTGSVTLSATGSVYHNARVRWKASAVGEANIRNANDNAYANLTIDGLTCGAITASSTVQLPAGTTTIAPLNIPSGVAKTSPADGDFWSDGSDLKIRLGGVTYTLLKV